MIKITKNHMDKTKRFKGIHPWKPIHNTTSARKKICIIIIILDTDFKLIYLI